MEKEKKAAPGYVSPAIEKLVLAAGVTAGSVAVVKKHIAKKGVPVSKEKCPLRQAVRVKNEHNQESRRITWCCKARGGLFLSDWRCIGLQSEKCIFKIAQEN